MSSICLAFCWPHLYRISDIFISQVAPLYCSDGFPLSFLLAFELNFPYTTHHHFFSRQKTGTDLAELTIHFLTQFHLSWACLFLAQYLMNSSKIFSTKSAMTPLTAWTKTALGHRFLTTCDNMVMHKGGWWWSEWDSPPFLSIRMVLFRTPSNSG